MPSVRYAGAGRVDMLTSPVAAARAGVATGASGEIGTRHVSDTWEVWELKHYYYPSAGGLKKKKAKRQVSYIIHE